jgi:hypothetical protein
MNIAWWHSFRHPQGDTITVRGDGQFAGRLDACLIGYLVTE